ncbi:hypothetical protein K7W42_07680 [Deinococcus sp. HMF7604]|uniref:hypothetical protein n=1 Tax=Deinococcus betulae TaxID=2873312 RepID=UPI001CC9FE88|nr:hypothetical protein [Deinococcus betulae]MBZ9750739.1 hypothetical protein [Deinococcus betulae]
MKASYYRARALAVDKLGPDADDVLAKLDAAGLMVVFRREVAAASLADAEVLENVTLRAPATWAAPEQVAVITAGGEVLNLYVHEDAAGQVGEAVQLQTVMGHGVDVTIDREAEVLLRAVAVDR